MLSDKQSYSSRDRVYSGLDYCSQRQDVVTLFNSRSNKQVIVNETKQNKKNNYLGSNQGEFYLLPEILHSRIHLTYFACDNCYMAESMLNDLKADCHVEKLRSSGSEKLVILTNLYCHISEVNTT